MRWGSVAGRSLDARDRSQRDRYHHDTESGADDGDYKFIFAQVFCGDALDIREGDGLVAGVILVAVIVSKAVELIEGRDHRVVAKVLPGDLLLSHDFGLGAFQLFVGEALHAQRFRLLEQLRFNERHLFGFSADVKGEKTRDDPKKILRADVIGQAKFFTDADEKYEAVTLAQAKAVAQKYLQPGALVVAIVKPGEK